MFGWNWLEVFHTSQVRRQLKATHQPQPWAQFDDLIHSEEVALGFDIFSCAILMTFRRAMVTQNAVPKGIEIWSSLVLNHTKASLNPQIHRCRKMIMFRHVQPYWKCQGSPVLLRIMVDRASIHARFSYRTTWHEQTKKQWLASLRVSAGCSHCPFHQQSWDIPLTSCHWAAQHCSPTANRCRRSFLATVPAPSPQWQRQQGTSATKRTTARNL